MNTPRILTVLIGCALIACEATSSTCYYVANGGSTTVNVVFDPSRLLCGYGPSYITFYFNQSSCTLKPGEKGGLSMPWPNDGPFTWLTSFHVYSTGGVLLYSCNNYSNRPPSVSDVIVTVADKALNTSSMAAGENLEGDPLNVTDGSVVRNETDLSIPAPGMPLAVGRVYNSLDAGGAGYSNGWSASSDWRMASITNSSPVCLRLRTGAGNTLAFQSADNTNWYSQIDERWHVCSDGQNGWLLDFRDGGNTMHFGSTGKWDWLSGGFSNRITGLRDSVGNLTGMVHSCGLAVSMLWSNNRIAAVTGPASLRVDYAYTSSGLLTGVTRRAASGQAIFRQYLYDATSGFLTNTVDAIGESLGYTYALQSDGSRRCTGSAFSDGSLATYATWSITNLTCTTSYPIFGNKTQAETIAWQSNIPAANATSMFAPGNYNYGASSNGYYEYPVAISMFSFVSNAALPYLPRISSRTRGGLTTIYSYNTGTLEVTGTVWQTSNQTASASSWLDNWGRVTNETRSLNGATNIGWRTEWIGNLEIPSARIDPLGWRTQCTWTNGLPASISQTNGYGGWLTTSMTYSQGMPVSVCDALGRATCMTYDSQGGVTSVTPPVGPVMTLTNDIFGNPVRQTLPAEDGGDRSWLSLRDGFGNITNAIDPDGLGTVYACDALGQVTNIIDRAGRSTSISYGVAGHPLAVTRHVVENGTARTVTTHTDRDLQMDPVAVRDGLDRTVEAYLRDDAGRVATVTNIEGRTATTTYGVLDLPLAVDRFDGSHVGMSYDGTARLAATAYPDHTNSFSWLANGLLASAKDSVTLVTNTWIAPGRLTSQRTQMGGWTQIVGHAYDAVANMTQTTATCGGAQVASITTGFDAGNRETNRVFAAGDASLSFVREYGSWNGLPTRIASANGAIEQRLGWDVMDRLTNIVWRSGTNEIRSVAFKFDVLGQITQRVDRVAGVDSVRAYTYDGLDRLASEDHGDGFAAGYGFDDAGRRTVKVVPQFDVTYTPGTGDRLDHWNVTYTNLPTTFQVAGCTSEMPGTNPAYRVQVVSNAVASVAPVMDGTNFTATLPMGPLGSQAVVVAISDAAGNVGVSTSVFVRTAFTTGEYTGDAGGCVTQIVYRGPACLQTKALSWDGEYRLAIVKTNGASAESYAYAPDGRRMTTTAADSTVTHHLWDGPNVVADTDSTGKVLRAYAYGPNVDELLAITVFTNGTPQTYYTIRDHQNTVWALVATNGTVVESYDFDAWGRVLSVKDGSGQTLSQSAVGNRYLFQGREYSWATGLYCFRARWYDAVTGRWLSPDPIGISGGLNQYVFCGNNPVNFVDPDGGSPYAVAGLAAVMIGALAQASVEIQGSFFLDRAAIAAEMRSNATTMDMLRQVIASEGEMDWPDNFGQGGQMGTDLAPQGGVCEKRQKVRNLFESMRNIRGYSSAGSELATRLATGAFEALPKNMYPGSRAELAKALLNRQQAYQNFLKRIY